MKKIYVLTYVAVCILVGFWITKEGFVPLFILLILFLLAAFFFMKKAGGGRGPSYKSFTYALMIGFFGFFSIEALRQYVNPKQDIFRNIDYHAIRVDGITLMDGQGFVLAGNRKDAFFDKNTYNGIISVRDTVNGKVRLNLVNFTEPVYLISGKEMRSFSLLNPTSLVSFHDNDVVQLLHQEVKGKRDTIEFQIVPGHVNYSRWNLLKHDIDTACYFFNGGIPSLETRFLKSGLPLSSLLAGIAPEFDPVGIQVFRGNYDYNVKKKNIDVAYEGQPYFLGFTAESGVSGVRINGSPVDRVSNCTIEIPFGTPFCIGFGMEKSETVCFGRNAGELTLEYYLPRYQYLTANNPDVDDQTLMVTTSLFDTKGKDELLAAYTENIALFSQFSHADNIFQMRPWYLSYVAGKSGTPINFSVYSDSTFMNQTSMDFSIRKMGGSWNLANRHLDSSGLRYQSYFKGIWTEGKTARWMVGVENFQNTTPFPVSSLSRLILLVVLLSIISIFLGGLAPNTIPTNAEYAVYLITIGFLTIRCYLLWRVTVFPPVSSISYYEFNHFRDPDLLYYLKLSVFGFYALIIVYKLFLAFFKFRVRSKNPMDALWNESRCIGYNTGKGLLWIRFRSLWLKFAAFLSRKEVFVCLMFGVYLVPCIFVRGNGSFARLMNILFPVLMFFVFEFFIFKLYGRNYSQDINEVENPIGYRLWPVLITFLNILFVVLYTFYRDGGYGVMFLLFGLIISIYLVSDLRFYTTTNRNNHSRIILYSEIALFVLAAVFGLVYKNIFIWILDDRKLFAAGVFVILNLVFFLLSNALEFRKQLPWWGWLVSAATSAVIALAVLFGASKFIDGTHLEYRTRVHMAPPSEILQENIDDFTSQNKFMQASLNDWILYEYADIGKEVSPFQKSSYFKLQPQSKLGAMWFAQTTDIALSRFIIAEHSVWLAVLLVIVLFIFLIIASFGLCEHRNSRFFQIAIPLLLFLQAGLILFANLRMFIFFGQDFPLVSVTSKLSSVYYFVLMGTFVVSLLRETDFVEGGFAAMGRPMRPQDRQSISEHDDGTNRKLVIAAGLCIILPTLLTQISSGKIGPNNKVQVSSLDGSYSLDALMESVHEACKELDSVFVEYQDHAASKLELRLDMHPQLKEFKITPEYIAFKTGLDTTNKFASRIIDRFIDSGSHYNSAKNLIHIRKEVKYDQGGKRHEHLTFDVNDDFFEYQLPTNHNKSWKGSIIGDALASNSKDARSRNGDLEAVRLKKEWIGGNSDLFLVRSSGAIVRIMGENSIIDLDRDRLPVALVSGKDEMLRGGKRVTLPIITHDNYFARSVLVNGTRTFLYPYGTEMFWIREFANAIKSSKETLLRKGDKEEIKQSFHGNVPITISRDLSRAIYKVYSDFNSMTDKTVVVADGDGHIKAMVDYRGDKKYRLNPNDERSINSISERLYMEGLRRSPEYQRFFTTFANSSLRLGPGSSQKPIVWSAVTAGYNSGFWNTLKILPLPTNPIVKKVGRDGKPFDDFYSGFYLADGGSGHFYFPFFGGQPIQRRFKSIAGDEGYPGSEINLEWYMYKSSNYYNAMMAYFGMFSGAQLEVLLPTGASTDEQGYLVKRTPAIKSSDVAKNREAFPIMSLKSERGFDRVSFSKGLTSSEYLNRSALFPKGLNQFFDLPFSRKNDNGLYQSIPRFAYNDEGELVVRPSYREASHFNMDVRGRFLKPVEMLEVGIRSVAIGNNTSWIVSPVKMAEMYGRILSLNQNYTLSLDPSHTLKYSSFPLDSSWGDSENAFLQYSKNRKSFIHGLSNVYSERKRGTAYGVYKNAGLKSLGVYLDTEGDNEIHEYYIYGKTGTINGVWDGKDRTDHLLAAIITDTKVSNAEDLSGMKYYVVYFADYGTSAFSVIDANVLKKVIQSDDFKIYMKQ